MQSVSTPSPFWDVMGGLLAKKTGNSFILINLLGENAIKMSTNVTQCSQTLSIASFRLILEWSKDAA